MANNMLKPPINILAIDDEETCLEVIMFSLSNLGYKVYTARSGEEGINFLENNDIDIDLVLLDMMLPDMYGLEILSSIKKISKMINTPVLMQTGTSNYEDLEQASKMGALAFVIRKPYVRKDLLKAVELALDGNKMEIKKFSSSAILNI